MHARAQSSSGLYLIEMVHVTQNLNQTNRKMLDFRDVPQGVVCSRFRFANAEEAKQGSKNYNERQERID